MDRIKRRNRAGVEATIRPTMAAVITFTRSLAIHIFSRKHVSHFWEGDRSGQKGEEPVQRLANPFHRVLLREIARPSQRSD